MCLFFHLFEQAFLKIIIVYNISLFKILFVNMYWNHFDYVIIIIEINHFGPLPDFLVTVDVLRLCITSDLQQS